MFKTWWNQRRPEIVELFDREIYGRVPATAPAIRWKLVKEECATEAGVRVVKRWYEGIADNRAFPAASAVIQLRYTVPAGAKGKMPLILSFGLATALGGASLHADGHRRRVAMKRAQVELVGNADVVLRAAIAHHAVDESLIGMARLRPLGGIGFWNHLA